MSEVEKYRKIVLEEIKGKPFTTCHKIAKQTNLNSAQVRIGLIALEKQGIVEKFGKNSWKVKT